MVIDIRIGDVRDLLAAMPSDSVDCVVTSPPYWGLRDYGIAGQIGMESTLGEHLAVMVEVFDAVRRIMKPEGTLWLNYGDCYATKPNGRSAADTKATGNDDRTFRDKPFSTVGAIYVPDFEAGDRRGGDCKQRTHNQGESQPTDRIVAGGTLKPKDLCMVPNRIAIALQDAGWWVRSEIIWGKPNSMPDSSGRYRPSTAHEKIWLLTKSANSYYDSEAVRMPAASDEISNGYPGSDGDGVRQRSTVGNTKRYKMPDNWDTGEGAHGSIHRAGREKGASPDKQRGHSRRHQGFNDRWDGMTEAEQCANGRLLRNYEPDLSPIIPPQVWEIATAGFSGAHFATFPPALVVPCILAGCPVGGVVLDPFGGAGTTGLVADRLQRKSILLELNPEYAAIARRRIDADRGGLLDQMEAALIESQ